MLVDAVHHNRDLFWQNAATDEFASVWLVDRDDGVGAPKAEPLDREQGTLEHAEATRRGEAHREHVKHRAAPRRRARLPEPALRHAGKREGLVRLRPTPVRVSRRLVG